MNSHRFQYRTTFRMLATALALTLPTLALAGNSQQDNAANAASNTYSHSDRLWKQLDTNNDGQVSRAEFDAYQKGVAARHENDTSSNASNGSSSNASASLDREMRARDLIGMNVQDRQGDDLGEIKDLIVDVNNGTVRSAILSFGGTLGIGGKLFRYPLSAFSSSGNSDELVLNVDDQALKSAKGFDRSNWAESKQRNVWQASRLLGKDVVDKNGEHLGEIQDLAINPRSGKIDYAMLKYDRPWSLDNPVVTVPLNSFNFGDGRHDVSMNVDRSQIDAQASASTGGQSNSPVGHVVEERWIFLVPATASSTSGNTQSAASTQNTDTTENAANSQNARDSQNAANSQNADNGQNASNQSAWHDTNSSGRNAASSGTSGANRSAQNQTVPAQNADATAMAPSTRETVQFDELDKNHDGRLDRQEFESGSNTAADFSKADKNNDQSVTRSEFANRNSNQ